MSRTIPAISPQKTFSTGQTLEDFILLRNLWDSSGYSLSNDRNEFPRVLTDPNYIPRNNAPLIIGLAVAGASLATICMIARIAVRLTSRYGMLLAEDWVILFGSVLAVALAVLQCMGAICWQWGYRSSDLTFYSLNQTTKAAFALSLLGSWCLTSIRLSLLLFIRRLYAQISVPMRRLCNALVVIFILETIGCTFSAIFICTPVSAAWSVNGRLSPACKTSSATLWTLTVFNFAEDVIVLLLPVRLIMLLTIPTWKKIESALMLSLGSLACALAVARFFYLKDAIEDYDWGDSIAVIQLTVMEACVSIITACIPSIKILLIRTGLPKAMSNGMSKCKQFVTLSASKGIGSTTQNTNMTESRGLSMVKTQTQKGTANTSMIQQPHIGNEEAGAVTFMNGRAIRDERSGSGDTLGHNFNQTYQFQKEALIVYQLFIDRMSFVIGFRIRYDRSLKRSTRY